MDTGEGADEMTTYIAIVSVGYHSGKMSLTVQISANSVYQAKLLLEHLYGQDSVLSVPTAVN